MRLRVTVPTLSLTYSSRFNLPNPGNDSRVGGIGNSVRFVLSDAIMEYAGYEDVLGDEISTSLQDQVLSNASFTVEYAQEAYVSK